MCGIVLLRLLKERSYYSDRYGDEYFALRKVRELMSRQRNRGQDAVGLASCVLPEARELEREYLFIDKVLGQLGLEELFSSLFGASSNDTRKAEARSAASAFVGHLLYSTLLSELDVKFVHPVEKPSSIPARRVALALNGNFANNREQRRFLRSLGHFPTSMSDVQALTECFGHFLDKQVLDVAGLSGPEIDARLDLASVMKHVHLQLKGAYAISGLLGNGFSFLARDPHGIRPLYYAADDEVIVGASEENAIQSAFRSEGMSRSKIQELPPGHILVVRPDGSWTVSKFAEDVYSGTCMLESVYFSRVEGPGVYTSRKNFGRSVAQQTYRMLAAHGHDAGVVSHVPNSAEPAALGLYEGLVQLRDKNPRPDAKPFRLESVITKDTKLRTFIASSSSRKDIISSVYNVMTDTVQSLGDSPLVLMEDSIIKGSTLQRRIVDLLAKAGTTSLFIVSSCPQLRFICPYGIEMASLGELLAFRAAVSLIQKRGQQAVLDETFAAARAQQERIDADTHFTPENLVQRIYDRSTYEDISLEIAEHLKPAGWQGELFVLYPRVDGFRDSLGAKRNDSCISGDYPEAGGLRVLNRALLNYFEKSDAKAY
jgi:amidophosphoribosyltransferase